MTLRFKTVLAVGTMLLFAAVSATAEELLESLEPDQVVQGFRTVNLYDDAAGKAMGARFINEKNGFIIDLVQIQSVPQAFYWIKTPVTESRGEPHACEHLLLGKGNRGRYIAALEDMALGNSTAYTEQYRTCYQFNTTAGDDTFYEIFEAKLQALLHPDFTDEEIRREVCNIGVVTNDDSSLSIDEKGTVYTEMVSWFELPDYYTSPALFKLVYGKDHPFTHCSGGNPDVMRSMVPQDMRDFHKATYHLANMGAVVSIPNSIPVDSFLKQMSQTLDHCQSYPDSSALPGIAGYDFPQPDAAPAGTTLLTTYPSDRSEDPGYLLYSWPASLTLDYKEQGVLELFLTTFATGQTSDLYNLFINSKTRQIDIGASEANGRIEEDFGLPISFSVTGVTGTLVNQNLLDSVGAMIIGAVRKVHDYADGSPDLKEFNNRTRNRLIELKKNLENHLNQPPMFGYRAHIAGAWLSKMGDLESVPGFRKSLVYAELIGRLDSLLALDNNIWRERIDTWRLLTVPPYAVAATPSPDIVKANAAAKEARLASYIENFEKKYGVSNSQEAIARYKAEFDANTAELEAANAKLVMPGFIDNPPMTADDQLDFKTITVAGKVPLVASTFENMTAARLGMAFRLDVIPESLMVYVPFLPSVMTAIGVVKDGEIIPFDKMQERLRQEVLGFNAYFSTGFGTGRVELVLAGHGGNRDELFNALGWMGASLYSPYLSKDNLPRILDRLDQMIQSGRNRMKGSEESWVNAPANGYRFDNNPLMMSTNCFLTQIHSLQRLRWLLTDPGDDVSQSQLAGFLQALETTGASKSRQELSDLLSTIESTDSTSKASLSAELFAEYQKLGDPTAGVIRSVAQALRMNLGDVPDASLASDWIYLCNRAKDDLLTDPQATLSGLNDAIGLIRRVDNARAFMTSNTADREAALPRIESLINKLGKQTSIRQRYADARRVVNRLAGRMPGLGKSLYVGLLFEGTQNGVLIMNARVAGEWDTTTSAVLNCLAGKMYGGGGPHGLFMKTWAAGLAYSNGYGNSQQSGRASYYAERCPDISETMKFVVNELKTAQPTPDLTDYAIAQVFGSSRSPDRYEARGEAMAADLADGYTPEVVRRYSEKVLQLRQRPNLLDELKTRMENVYGTALIGYGRPLSESTDGHFFIIGPEKQFQSFEQYIASTEGPQTVYRLYPRDFWLTL